MRWLEMLLLLSGAGPCLAADILLFLPLPTFSHTNAFLPIFEELARRGHNVTVVSPYPREVPIPNYKDIVVRDTMPDFIKQVPFDLHDFNNFLPNLLGLWMICPVFLDLVLTLPEVKSFINDDRSHFDVVFTETWFCQEPFTALSHKYSAHLIGIQPLSIGSVVAAYTGDVVPYSYVNHLKIPASDRMSFTQRALSTLYYTSELILTKLVYERKQEWYMREHFKYPGSENLPPIQDLLTNHSLLLLDTHLSLTFPKPYLPRVVEFGGLTVKDPKPLPKDLEDYMSSAKDGVIFLSWGSHYKTTNMKPKTLAKFLSVFSKLKQNVLMKWENPDLPGKPDNVRIAPWFPQASVLSHPKLKAFISHCGIHGVSEATYHGVPVLGTPLFADQYQNIKMAENAGFAILLDIDDFTEDFLLEALNKLIYDPSYKEAALRRSAIFKDRPLSPLDNAVYWIEYVLRHNGARHLRPASLDLYWYQYFLLDIIVALLLAITVPVVLVSLCIKTICSRKKETQRSNPKKNKRD